MMQRKSFVAGALFARRGRRSPAAQAAAASRTRRRTRNPKGVLVAPQAPREIIRRSVDLVTTNVIVRDDQGQFVANLGKNDFDVYEDGVKQDLITFVLTHGGRVLNDVSAPPPPVQEGILLPPPRPTNDASGRIFLIFVDDLHMDFRNTGRIRDLFKKISKELIHDGDMFGIVSTGPLVDRDRHDLRSQAARRGDQQDLRRRPEARRRSSRRPTARRGRPKCATARTSRSRRRTTSSQKLEQVHNRRKAFIYVSNGYDFDPFSKSRAKEANQRYSHDDGQQQLATAAAATEQQHRPPRRNPFSKGGQRVRRRGSRRRSCRS